MNAVTHFLTAHSTIIPVVGLWLFSALCSTMPPLKPDAGYWATWSHNFLQIIAANANKFRLPKENP